MQSCKVSDKQEREEGYFPDVFNKATVYLTTKPGEIKSHSDKYKETGGLCLHSNVLALKIQAQETAAEGFNPSSAMCVLLMTSNKVGRNCAGTRQDASRRQSHHRQRGQ